MIIIYISIAYIIGSIPCGLIIAKTFCGIDPRYAGSANVGSTNVARLCGKKFGIATLICDILKGTLPILLAVSYVKSPFFISLIAFALVIGHCFSCFLSFNGGKAVATTIGIYLALAFYPTLIGIIICIACIKYSGFVSLGSLVFVVIMPIILLISGYSQLLPLALCIMLLVIWTHRYNIQRLICGCEKSWKKSAYKE